MWMIKGTSIGIKKPIVAKFSSEKASLLNLFKEKTIKIVNEDSRNFGIAAGLSSERAENLKIKGVYELPLDKLADLSNGDILKILPNGEVQRLWDIKSKTNALFLTDCCNSRCIMCPQPSGAQQNYFDDILKILSLLECVDSVCITGGEPTLLEDKLVEIFAILKKRFPSAELMMLTNGRKFEEFMLTKKIMLNAPTNTTFGIPLYSPVATLHDEIVGARGAFAETVSGLHNLFKFNAKVELRVVITKQNYRQLPELANFIGWNLPMVRHVAFMGMEIHGLSEDEIDNIWIEPLSYQSYLKEAVKIVSYRNIPVSIYNLPHCLVEESVQKFCRKSISEWKQFYYNECNDCTLQQKCSGFFSTSSKQPNIPKK